MPAGDDLPLPPLAAAELACDVLVVGAGIVGLAIALHLQREGRQVTVIDRKGVAAEASRGNAGAFAFTDILPLASPGMLRKAPRWLLDPLGPLSIAPAYLPRIAPWRYGIGLDYQQDRLGARLDATVYSDQDRVAVGELPTDGYTMLNAAVTYRLPAAGMRLEAFLRGVNLLNEEARNHVSFLKDIAPQGRRSAQLGVRGQF